MLSSSRRRAVLLKVAAAQRDPRLAAAGVSGYNTPRRTPDHPTKSHIVVAKEGGSVKTIRFGQQGVRTNQTAGQREAFKSRHAKNIARGRMSAAYWADKVKWSPSKTQDKDNERWVKGSGPAARVLSKTASDPGSVQTGRHTSQVRRPAATPAGVNFSRAPQVTAVERGMNYTPDMTPGTRERFLQARAASWRAARGQPVMGFAGRAAVSHNPEPAKALARARRMNFTPEGRPLSVP